MALNNVTNDYGRLLSNTAQVLIITIILCTNTLIRRIVRNNLDALGTLCLIWHLSLIHCPIGYLNYERIYPCHVYIFVFYQNVLNFTENVLTLTNYQGTVRNNLHALGTLSLIWYFSLKLGATYIIWVWVLYGCFS